jgi:hypothetical protein
VKYVIMVTSDGQHLPVIFPDSLTHSVVAQGMQRVIADCFNGQQSGPYHAGFVALGLDVSVGGDSESLGLKSHAIDAVRIVAGEAVSHMPDVLVAPLANKLRGHR